MSDETLCVFGFFQNVCFPESQLLFMLLHIMIVVALAELLITGVASL